jgi:hypothetical protein
MGERIGSEEIAELVVPHRRRYAKEGSEGGAARESEQTNKTNGKTLPARDPPKTLAYRPQLQPRRGPCPAGKTHQNGEQRQLEEV